MSSEELPWEELDHLYKLSSIPMLIVFFVILIYFICLMHTSPLVTAWDYIIRIGLLFFFVPYTVAMLSFEVLYGRKAKKGFNFKRFGGRMFFLLTIILSLFGFLILTHTVFSHIIGDWNTSFLSIVVWLVGFFVIVTKFRQFFTKLNEGKW